MRERIVRAVAGSFVLASIALAYYINVNWLLLSVFVGLNLLQSSFTKFCPWKKYWISLALHQTKTTAADFRAGAKSNELSLRDTL